jgi:hypothetical protein
MPNLWERAILNTNQLKIFAGTNASAGSWARIFDQAIREFNSLSNSLNLGVTFVRSTIPPHPSGVGGADVQFETTSGQVNFVAFNQPFSINVDGDGLIGHTQLIMSVTRNRKRIGKAFIFLPVTPKASSSRGRDVGDGVKLVMAVHEMIHACGLSNADHSPAATPDLFFAFPQLDTDSNPANDKISVDPIRMPPLVISSRTQLLIQLIWKMQFDPASLIPDPVPFLRIP